MDLEKKMEKKKKKIYARHFGAQNTLSRLFKYSSFLVLNTISLKETLLGLKKCNFPILYPYNSI